MEQLKRFSNRSLLWIIFFAVLLTATLDYLLYQGINLMLIKAGEAFAIDKGMTFEMGLSHYLFLKTWFLKVFVPGSMAVGLLFALIIWGVVRQVFKGCTGDTAPAPAKKDKSQAAAPVQVDENDRKRLYLHLISVLQKEGRLLDFFHEKLDTFEDAQIGAAVRQIHENCAKTLAKYLTLEPVLDKNEGDTLAVENGFNPAEIKLTGNVVGNPPFNGVLRHKGWKVSKLDIPTLSKQENPGVLAPAEVDIE